MIGDVLWTPAADWRQSTVIGRYMNWLRDHRGRDFGSYEALWRWSVDDLEGFWASIWNFYSLWNDPDGSRYRPRTSTAIPGSGATATGYASPSEAAA
jgi:acetoacetyl-CoA synthetase